MRRIGKAFLKLLKPIGDLFAFFVSPSVVRKLLAGLEVVAPYLDDAYALAKLAAARTPTRSDDEIFALADALGVPALFDEGEDRGVAIGRIVFRALRKRFPDVADRVLNRAIEIAYGATKP